MNDPNEEVVNPPTVTPPVDPQEPVTQDPAAVEPAEETVPLDQTPQPSVTESDVDERGVPWKNVAMEAQRKLTEMPQVIRQTVEEVMQKNQPKKQEYTIDQLEQFAIDNPQHRPWVEKQKAEIIQTNLEKSFDAKIQATRTESEHVNIRQQSEQWVVAHPKFKECFSSDAFGNKIWNMSHPLTQAMGAILNTTDPITGKMVKDRPDGLRVAAEMAYGRLMLSNEPKAIGQVNQLKKDLRKVQKQTIVQGGGTPQAVSPKSPVRKHLESYTKTYSKNDIKSATKDFLLASGLIKED